MLDPLTERLRNAIEDGEFLTVIYSGGNHPGTKRRILPLRIAGHLLYARNSASMAIKTYRLDSISLASDDNPAPWMQETPLGRQRATRVDPINYFASWAYGVSKALWPALGVSLREYVDQDKSTALRSSLAKEGHGSRGSNLPTVKYLAYAVGDPPTFDFHEGDLFFPKGQGLLAVQVVAIRKLIEVHQVDTCPNGLRSSYQIVDTELADWLREGVAPQHARIDASQSYSEVLRFSIKSD
jgi:hypothetical protein